MHQPLFVFYDSAGMTIPPLPEETLTFIAKSPDQILSIVQKAQQENQAIVFLVTQTECYRLYKLMEARAAREKCPPYSWVVVCEKPDSFLQSPHIPRGLLDIISHQQLVRESQSLFSKFKALMRDFSLPEISRISSYTLQKLNEVLLKLTAERDPKNLLIGTLSEAIDLLNAQAGTLLGVGEEEGELVFKYQVQDTGENKIILNEINHLVQESSICGYVVLTGKTVNTLLEDSSRTNSQPALNRQIDHQQGSPIVSLISIPLKDSRGDCRAVLQLCNKMSEGKIISFDEDDESILRSFATQAAICLESSDIYIEVQKLFEGFVRASITAIESRDPSTGGHSERVASMSVALARATTEVNSGIYRSVKFKEPEIKELEYAALLHDFGKIGIREEVLVKSKKLYGHQLDAICERLQTFKAAAKIQYLEKVIQLGKSGRGKLEEEYQNQVEQIDRYWNLILAANEPNILHKENETLLVKIRDEKLALPDGSEISLLRDEEYLALSVTQGSLTELERLEIESHVRHTYQFLKMIPWTRDFRSLTEIAYCHHEKLDGTGYPRGLTNHEIPLQSKIMTIADIFDALTAADRWYKEAVPVEKALEILAQEVKEGKIDPVLFEIFRERRIYAVSDIKSFGKVA
ncbi:MAG: HD domain-containing phosphohydrolase [Pseudomonadota bacterium]